VSRKRSDCVHQLSFGLEEASVDCVEMQSASLLPYHQQPIAPLKQSTAARAKAIHYFLRRNANSFRCGIQTRCDAFDMPALKVAKRNMLQQHSATISEPNS
jgi:hypothetical protein